MLIKQIPTSSSSSNAGADGGDRQTSSQANKGSPSPPTPTLQTSTAAPPPVVDAETLRCLDKILRSIPSEIDDATAYATLKARLGIVQSRVLFPTSTSQNPTSIPQTQAHSLAPEPTPIVPLVQYSGDDSDEEGAQPDATPVAKTEAVLAQLHEEGTTTPNTPTPPSGGGSNSPTLIGPTQPIEVVNIYDDSTEDVLPLPNEILQQRETKWNFVTHADDESVPDREEEPLHHRTSRMEINRLTEEVEAVVAKIQRVRDEQVEKPRVVRSILDVPEESENQGAIGALN